MRVRILGPLEVGRDGTWRPIGATKWRALLASLVVHANQPVPVDRLIEELWPDGPPRTAANQVHGYVARLRRALDDPDGTLLRTRSPGYELALAPGDLDAERFETLAAKGEQALHDNRYDDSDRLLSEALELWRGPAFTDVLAGPDVAAEAGRLSEARLTATEARVDAGLALGRHTGLVAELRTLVAEHPFRERFSAQLMLALYRSGRQADALAVYRKLYQRLGDELGVEPGRELQDLNQQILTGDDGPAPVRAQRERVVPRQLPAVARHFAGREDELKALDELVATGGSDGVVMAAIAGTAGVGKTAVAIRWAHRAAPEFPDGQLYVNLRGFDPGGLPVHPSDALRGFLTALGVPPERVPQALEAQAALYRSLLADRRVLVVLDNARDTGQVRPLVPGSASCMVVVTSRARLTGLIADQGAHPLALDLLTPADAEQLLRRHLGPDRVGAEPAAVADLLHRCARLPLALAIAAARAAVEPGLSLRALADDLAAAGAGQLLDALDTGEENTTARAVFSWSYRGLSETAQRMFRLLGLHPGPDISAAAAASLAGSADTGRALAELVRVHLVAALPHGRYGFHDLLRAYAAELVELDADRRASTRRMAEHYLHTAHAGAALLSPHRDPIELAAPQAGVVPEQLTDSEQALEWFETERPVLLALVERAAANGCDDECWQLAWTMVDFLDWRGHWHDWIDSQRTALAAVSRLGDRSREARSHRYLASAYNELHDHTAALAHLSQGLDLMTGLDEPAGQAQTHLGLSDVLQRQGEWTDARRHTQQSLWLFRAAGHRIGEANALNTLGACDTRLGDLDRAVEHCREALAIFENTGHLHGLAATLSNLGDAFRRLGDHQQAVECYRSSVARYDEIGGDLFYLAITLVDLGDVHLSAGTPADAQASWRRALEILDELGHPDAEQVRERLATGRVQAPYR